MLRFFCLVSVVSVALIARDGPDYTHQEWQLLALASEARRHHLQATPETGAEIRHAMGPGLLASLPVDDLSLAQIWSLYLRGAVVANSAFQEDDLVLTFYNPFADVTVEQTLRLIGERIRTVSIKSTLGESTRREPAPHYDLPRWLREDLSLATLRSAHQATLDALGSALAPPGKQPANPFAQLLQNTAELRLLELARRIGRSDASLNEALLAAASTSRNDQNSAAARALVEAIRKDPLSAGIVCAEQLTPTKTLVVIAPAVSLGEMVMLIVSKHNDQGPSIESIAGLTLASPSR